MTREKIINAAFDLATKIGYGKITRDGIAIHAGVASGSLNYYFQDMEGVRREVMNKAIADEQLDIIAVGLGMGDPVARTAPAALCRKALDTLL